MNTKYTFMSNCKGQGRIKRGWDFFNGFLKSGEGLF